MGAYEVFKTSQVELCNTLSGELENSKNIIFTSTNSYRVMRKTL